MEKLNIVSQTIMYKGYPVKISGGKIFMPAFGTTYDNHSMHWSHIEVPVEKLNDDFRQQLKQQKLI